MSGSGSRSGDGAGDRFRLTMLWSANPILAARADAAGIDRIGLDFETMGKAERQRGLGTWVSPHREDELPAMRRAVTRGELFCRLNPIHEGTRDEIDRVVALGVEVLMLPMFTTAAEVGTFVRHVDGRAKVVPLLEHRLAADRVDDIAAVDGLDGIHVGLTDLALSLGLANRFSLLAAPLLDRIADAVHRRGLRLGVGAIGRACDGTLPVPSDLVYAQYPRLGATGALVSRSFFGPDPETIDVAAAVEACRERMAWWRGRSMTELAEARARLAECTGG